MLKGKGEDGTSHGEWCACARPGRGLVWGRGPAGDRGLKARPKTESKLSFEYEIKIFCYWRMVEIGF